MSIVIPSQGIADLPPITPHDASAPHPGGFPQMIEQVNGVLERADQLAAGYAQGKVDLTDAVIASEKADTAFQLLMAVRNRALSAYQEIMNLQA